MTATTREPIKEALATLEGLGFEPTLSDATYRNIDDAGFSRVTLWAAFGLTQLALQLNPITVRGLMYQGQVAGLFPDTSDKYYELTGRTLLKLRRKGIVPWNWIVDSTRRRLKPSSWSGIADFSESAANSYRLDLWSRQKNYVEVFVEKDAMAGLLEPVTRDKDIFLNIIRGQVSETFVHEIAEQWDEIKKPIFIYYLGDHDPAGIQIEASLKSKLAKFCSRSFHWERLAITADDFANQNLRGFPVKVGAKGRAAYIEQFGDRCIEVDSIRPDIMRDRLREAIESHIDMGEWARLQETERHEQETIRGICKKMGGDAF